MIILGIDPGTACGWSLRGPEGRHVSGVWDLKPRRHEGGGMRFLRLRGYLASVLDGRVDAVFYEAVRRHLGVDAAHIYGGIVAEIAAECEDRKIPYRGLHVQDIKKFATGKGNANKEAMLAAARARWPGVDFQDDNEADARWIAEAGAREIE